ncbi:PTS sugar transporter subunit IIA [Carnobacterium gallinarum]|uniref:PTS sugar transporter subunit IIA n=1 Tax=Carnobacterium gallinarum TaxID=2749 RepID=UPI00054DD7EF|nr:PTS sugar transporter subunit IIA [Carnobacterium gallinarum]
MEKEPIILLTHGGWGESLLQSVKMIVGQTDNIHEVVLKPEDNLQDFLERVKNQIDAVNWREKLLILTDIKGGTTSNVALRLSRDYNILALSGLNTAMLLDAVMKQATPYTETDGEEILQASLENCQILKLPTTN